MAEHAPPDSRSAGGGPGEVFRTFLRLGLTSFGGPVAHIAYYRREFVERRRWIDEHQFAQLLALCQFIPGPASSQFGFALGMHRAGWAGALAAFTAFSLPSVTLMIALALALPALTGSTFDAGVHGLKLVALVVVAHGVYTMAGELCPDRERATIAVLSAALLLVLGGAGTQLLVVVAGGAAGLLFCTPGKGLTAARLATGYGPRVGIVLLGLFALLLVVPALLTPDDAGLTAAAAGFYRAGALVFGGGHVVLPLLEATVVAPGWITQDDFLAGYGAAQAVPGPMFSIAAYLGALLPGDAGGVTGALVVTLALFLPGFLLLAGLLPLWDRVVSRPGAARLLAGVNAAVVGLLAAALYDPIWVSAVRDAGDVAIALLGFLALHHWRLSPLWVVAWCVAASLARLVLT